ncbi:alpha/beta fold hydrolase [Streptomyces sp. NBC_01803]|uniref:alpha/beta fold hydrolase n=1 Tax=Streptomyces sp. NBC_01803 TaxID=2975946 RepID=UPI002DD9EAD0|nr:alpha/beta fold hydrolase [Streptomyces sp. NBC_01803]WSA43825.1 alpha/beta hydrolase [Streptomyces sp. NBC_01803]
MRRTLLTYDDDGEGPELLLLHSSVCDRRMWDPQWRMFLDAGYRVLRCDFRGFGDTPAADGPYRDADDVADLLDALGIGRTAVVGSSFGGRVALELAARRPGRVTALALLSAGAPGHEPSATLREFDERENALVEAGDLAGAVELNVATWLGPDADGNTRAMVRLMRRRAFDVQLAAEDVEQPGVTVDLARVTAPTLAVAGAHDLPDFRAVAAGLPATLPDARHLELPWAGHLPSLERPAETARLLLDFLARHTKPGP